MLVKFKKTNGKSIILFSCSNFQDDKSFRTRTLIRDLDNEFFTAKEIERNQTYQILPKVEYEIYQEIQINERNCNEADLVSISYYGGTDTKAIIEAVDEKTFIVDDRLPIRKISDDYREKPGLTNDILKYIGLKHVEKPQEQKQFEKDCYTKIELLPECNRRFYKKSHFEN